jgi:alpha-amylase/alpha-mannosidase (GH57 family)
VSTRFVVFHGHLYQPPREDPWTGEVPVEASAAPYHDWNERITAECYRPNAHARLLGPGGGLLAVRNNYARVSFDLGPTLASWLEDHAADVYEALVAADHGRGLAIAHPWVHAILPLCNERDRRTLIRWGCDDYRRRFGREPEGMWLPETAADVATLEALADAGVRFTLLAPHQLTHARPGPDAPWREGVDPRLPHAIELPSGRSVVALSYAGGLSAAAAFEGLLHDGEAFAQRVLGAVAEGPEAGVTAVVIDFETYGHHHRGGEMALAKALAELDSAPGVSIVSAQAAIAALPWHEGRLREPSAWSCAHGVGRWREDCSCRIGPETPKGQAWRAPLRDGLDWLRDAAARAENLASALEDPWAARDAYGEVLTGVVPFEEWVPGRLAAGADPERAGLWLELQRHLLLMYSSCGWFFDDAAGHETVLVLRHAARALDLVAELGGPELEDGLVARLEPMASEDARYPDGRAIWRQLVRKTDGSAAAAA